MSARKTQVEVSGPSRRGALGKQSSQEFGSMVVIESCVNGCGRNFSNKSLQGFG
jgi:hypothetical protein